MQLGTYVASVYRRPESYQYEVVSGGVIAIVDSIQDLTTNKIDYDDEPKVLRYYKLKLDLKTCDVISGNAVSEITVPSEWVFLNVEEAKEKAEILTQEHLVQIKQEHEQKLNNARKAVQAIKSEAIRKYACRWGKEEDRFDWDSMENIEEMLARLIRDDILRTNSCLEKYEYLVTSTELK